MMPQLVSLGYTALVEVYIDSSVSNGNHSWQVSVALNNDSDPACLPGLFVGLKKQYIAWDIILQHPASSIIDQIKNQYSSPHYQ